MSNQKLVPIALIGLGGVGQAILSQLLSPPLSSKFRIALVANSKKSLSFKAGEEVDLGKVMELLGERGEELDLPGVIGKLATLADGEQLHGLSFHSRTLNL